MSNPRYVLVEVDDEATASALIDNVNSNDNSRVAGVFLRPDDFCQCGNWTSDKGQPPITQLPIPKVGWTLCTQCMKPIPQMGRLINQLKPADIADPLHERVLRHDLAYYCYTLSMTALDVNQFRRTEHG